MVLFVLAWHGARLYSIQQALVTSQTLQLTFEDGGVKEMFEAHDTVNDGKLIEFDDFVTVMVKLMDMHSDVSHSTHTVHRPTCNQSESMECLL